MKNWTNDAEFYFFKRLESIEESLSNDIKKDEVIEDIKIHVYEKINEKNILPVTKKDIESIINEMGFEEKPDDKNKNKHEWLAGEINIFKFIKLKRNNALLALIMIPVFYIIILFTGIILLYSESSDFYRFIIIILACGIPVLLVTTILIIKLFRININILIIISIILAAVSFICESVLNINVFPDFSFETVLSLWIVFFVLFVSIFYKFLPKVLLLIILPVLLYGVFICISFVVYLWPMLIFGWIGIIFLIGFLPYSPFIAAIAFIFSFLRIVRYLKCNLIKFYKLAVIITIITTILLAAFLIVTIIKYNNLHYIYEKINSITNDNIYGESPKWVRFAQKAPKDIFTKMWLYNNNLKVFVFEQGLSEDSNFDAVTYLPAVFFGTKLDVTEIKDLKNSLFSDMHSNYERNWDGNNIKTTSTNENIQIFPENRTAYVEMVINIENTNQYSQEEAIYTVKLPENAVAVKLSLWINDKEEDGVLTLKSKAKVAYNNIVGVQKRDPAILEWVDKGVLRLNVFPVTMKNPRKVKIGYIVPLILDGDKLVFNKAEIEGQDFSKCEENIIVDVFTNEKKLKITGENIKLSEKLTSDNEIRQLVYNGIYKPYFKIVLDNVNLNGVYNINDEYYKITGIEYNEIKYSPDKIYVLLDNTKNKVFWKNLVNDIVKSKKNNTKLVLVSDEFFYSENTDKLFNFINVSKLPDFHTFPFYKLNKLENNLIVTSSSDKSINYYDTKDSDFYNNTEKFFSENKNRIYIFDISGGHTSRYLKVLNEMNRISYVVSSSGNLIQLLEKSSIKIPKSENRSNFGASYFSIALSKGNDTKTITGNDILPRLYYYKKLMEMLGEREFQNDYEFNDLLLYANDAKIVTPLSSFVVLENQNDYDNNNIEKIKSKFDKANLKDKDDKNIADKLGLVPEPHEWMLIILVLSVFIFLYRKLLIEKIELFLTIRKLK